jgi:hypothetical protein
MWRSVVQPVTADGSKNRDAITFNSKVFHKKWMRDPWNMKKLGSFEMSETFTQKHDVAPNKIWILDTD